jgi:hypothetical protein
MAVHTYGFVHRLYWKLFALWKRLLSYRKRDWELKDYPVIFRTQDIDPEPRPKRLQLQPHVAQIANWWICGTGETPAEALRNLEEIFRIASAVRKEEGTKLPRPGVNPPIEFASSARIEAVGELSDDFIHRILGFEWAMISDESSLWDFHSEETNNTLIEKIRQVYGVDVSDIESAKLCEILERIKQSRPKH